MADSEAGPCKGCISKPVWKRPWLTEAELHAALEESDEEPFVASETDDYIPEPADSECEESDVENEPVIEQEEEYDSDESIEEEPALTQHVVFVSKNGTQWRDTPHPQAQTLSRNILRQKGGATAFSALFTAKEIFKSIMSNEICYIIVRESNRKGRIETENYNAKLIQRYKASERPSPKVFKPFTDNEFEAFLGILFAAGVHKSNREHITEMWKTDSSSLFRAAMSRDRLYSFRQHQEDVK